MISVQQKSFSKFALVSLQPNSSFPPNKISDWGKYNLSAMTCMSANICDQFPMIDKDSFTREALNAFCFPEGLKLRIIPKCLFENAEKLGYLGKKSDRYQIHVVGKIAFKHEIISSFLSKSRFFCEQNSFMIQLVK